MWRAMQKISGRYVTPRLLSLHPPTKPNTLKGSSQSCRTCYTEKQTGAGEKKVAHALDRGMITADKSPVSGVGDIASSCSAVSSSSAFLT